jgi:hypothetical protein
MKLHWVVDAERRMQFAEHGFTRKVLKFLDGARDWHSISTAPFNRDLEVCVIEHDRNRVVPYPCRQTRNGWINGDLDVRAKIEPTKWRSWPEEPLPCKKFNAKRPRRAARTLLISE